MAYTNNGDYRLLELTIKTVTNGVTDQKTYSLLASFTAPDGTAFTAITVQQAQQMGQAAWQQRVGQFILYAEAQAGIDYEPAAQNSPYGASSDVNAPEALSCPVASW